MWYHELSWAPLTHLNKKCDLFIKRKLATSKSDFPYSSKVGRCAVFNKELYANCNDVLFKLKFPTLNRKSSLKRLKMN